ncbi:carbohydrate kinase family protein [Bacillus salipaludis]|uniref:Carbohydrate kinase family protein n=1 Tax=Bacillus salipaludis TaxID=2547811 RepID=A0ABW8RHV5_9BACI
MDNYYSFFVGDVALDEYYQSPYWPNLKEKIMVEEIQQFCGGMIANAASVYAGYKESVYFLSLLNSGNTSQILCEDLRRGGIDTRYILFDDTLPDSRNMIFLTENEHTVFTPNLGIEQIEITPEILEAMCKARYVYTNIIEIRNLRCGQMKAIDIIKTIRASGAKMVYDLDVVQIQSGDEIYFEEMDIAFFNEVGFNVFRNDLSYEEAVSKLLSYGTQIVVVTFAEKGCKVHTKDQTITVQGIPVEVVDVTGAGDTFCSSFTYGLNKTDDLEVVANFANAAGARAVTIMGPRGGVASSQAIIDFMREKGMDTEKYRNYFID